MEANVRDFILDFTSILYEALPFVILGAVFAGFVEEFVPQRLVTRFIPRNRTLAIAASGLLGLLFPMCECGIIVVMRRLLRKGLNGLTAPRIVEQFDRDVDRVGGQAADAVFDAKRALNGK